MSVAEYPYRHEFFGITCPSGGWARYRTRGSAPHCRPRPSCGCPGDGRTPCLSCFARIRGLAGADRRISRGADGSYSPPPKSQKWEHVVGLIAGGSDVERIAAASADAAEHGLERASQDQGLTYAFWLLTQIRQAARQSDFAEQLERLGLEVSSKPTLLEIVGAFTNAVDRYVRTRGNRSDLGEMAQHAAAETLTTLAGRELPNLFGPTAGDVQQAFAKLGSSDRFSVLARDFFSRLTSRSLGYFLSRALSTHVGPNRRFAAVSERSDFNAALDLHCREASTWSSI